MDCTPSSAGKFGAEPRYQPSGEGCNAVLSQDVFFLAARSSGSQIEPSTRG